MANLVTPMPMIRARFFDDNSRPLSGGKIYTYEPNTTTPKTTYKDLAATTPNTNPILLDVAGEADIYFDGQYRVIVESWRGEQLYDVDNIGALAQIKASFVVDASGKTQQELNTEQAKLNLSIINFVNPKMFGAIGDGVADDAQAIRDCFNFMIANNASLYDFSGSRYKYNSEILITAPNENINILGNCEFYSDAASITITGTNQEIGYINAAANKGDQTVTLNQNVTLNGGDIIAIHNSRTSSLSTHRDYYYDGEMKIVESASTNTIKFRSQLETSYPSGIEDKVWKVNPVKLKIQGVTFTGNYSRALKVSLCVYSEFNFYANNLLNTATSSSAFFIDRSLLSKVTGGKYIKLGQSGSGTDYGIAVGNSQDIKVMASYCYGGRHGTALGGDNLGMAVPNRRVSFEGVFIENDPTASLHAADTHGNCVDCYYKQCTIKGRISLSGYNTKSIQNNIYAPKGDVRAPIGLSEIVGGKIESIGDVIHSSGDASYIIGWLTSSIIPKVLQPCTFVLQDITFAGNANLVGVYSILNMAVASNYVLDGFQLTGTAAAFDRLMNYAAGTEAIKPAYIQITRPKYAVSEAVFLISGDASLASITKQVFSSSGSNTNGTWIKQEDGSMICRHKLSATVAINTAYAGGFKSADFTWTYPKAFITNPPTIMAVNLDNSCIAAKAINVTTSQVTVFGVALTSFASAGVVIDVMAIGRHLS